MHTTFRNQLDNLVRSLDCSGAHRGEIGSAIRREECFEKFIGPPGRVKDIALFYFFCICDATHVKFVSRQLPKGLGATCTDDYASPASNGNYS